MTAATKAEVEQIMASRAVATEMMVQMRNRFLVDETSGTIRYLPDHMTKIWACNRAEETLKATKWYELFLWMVEKKGYEWRGITREEEADIRIDQEDESSDEEAEEEESIGPLEEFEVFNAIDMKRAEKQMMADVDVMSFTRNDEKHLLARKISGCATASDIAALKKYGVQKYFRQELPIDDICTVLSKKRAVLNACSMLKLSIKERGTFFLVDAHGKKEYDFLRSDYLVLRHMDHLLRMLGYTGLRDRETRINVMALDAVDQDGAVPTTWTLMEKAPTTWIRRGAVPMTWIKAEKLEAARKLREGVLEKLGAIRKLRKQDRNRANSITLEIKGILKRLLGLQLQGERKMKRGARYSVHTIQEMEDIWRLLALTTISSGPSGRQP